MDKASSDVGGPMDSWRPTRGGGNMALAEHRGCSAARTTTEDKDLNDVALQQES